MNDYVQRMLDDRMRRTDNRNMDGTDRLDYDDGYMDGYADARRGMRRSGNMDRRSSGNMDRRNRRDYTDDVEYYDRADNRRTHMDRRVDGKDSEMYLTRSDMMQWKRDLQNADGTDGPHFKLDQIRRVIDNHGIKLDGFDEKELCMAANVLYSDLCEALRGFIPPDKEAMAYTKMAEATLCDDDGPPGPIKLARYYHYIATYE